MRQCPLSGQILSSRFLSPFPDSAEKTKYEDKKNQHWQLSMETFIFMNFPAIVTEINQKH